MDIMDNITEILTSKKTKKSSKKEQLEYGQCAMYDFRANIDWFSNEDIIKWLKANTKMWTFQHEMGDDGYQHFQGRFSLLKKRQRHLVLQLFSDQGLRPPNFCEPTCNEEFRQTGQRMTDEQFYMTKVDTRIAGPWSDRDKETYIPWQYQIESLYPWQQSVLDLSKIRCKRTINVIYDPQGNHGKTTLSMIAMLKHGAFRVPPVNEYIQLMGILCDYVMTHGTPSTVFIDMPRAIDKNKLGSLYSAIEECKNGYLFDLRYKFRYQIIDSPAIWVFTNVLPYQNYLSMDRWKFWSVKDKQLIPFIDPYEMDDDPLDKI